MWVLEKNASQPDKVFYLNCGERFMVSRKQGSILLLNDQSISRNHASITVTHPLQNLSDPEKRPEVVLFDCASKFGTYINDGITNKTKIAEKIPITLKAGDRIRFGLFQNEWRLNYRPLIVTSTLLNEEEKQTLINLIQWLGGHFLKQWSDDCTHLVSSELKLTPKAVFALASAIPIITVQYFEKLKSNIIQNVEPPDIKSYIPTLKEARVNKSKVNLAPDQQRSSILQDKKIVFCSKTHYQLLSPLVKLTGGTAIPFSSSLINEVTNSNYILIKPKEDSTISPNLQKALDNLKSAGLYAVPDAELGLAVLFGSTERYCNPSFNAASLLKSTNSVSQQSTMQSLKVYATETQDLTMDMVPPKKTTSQIKGIPDSGKSSISASNKSRTNLDLTGNETPSISQLNEIEVNENIGRNINTGTSNNKTLVKTAMHHKTGSKTLQDTDDSKSGDYNQLSDTEMFEEESQQENNSQLSNIQSRKRTRSSNDEEHNASKKPAKKPVRDLEQSIVYTLESLSDEVLPLDFKPKHTSTQNISSEGNIENRNTIEQQPVINNRHDKPHPTNSLTKHGPQNRKNTAAKPSDFVPFTLPSIGATLTTVVKEEVQADENFNPPSLDEFHKTLIKKSKSHTERELLDLQSKKELQESNKQSLLNRKATINDDHQDDIIVVKSEQLSYISEDSSKKRDHTEMRGNTAHVDSAFQLPPSKRRNRGRITSSNTTNKNEENCTSKEPLSNTTRVIPETPESTNPSTSNSTPPNVARESNVAKPTAVRTEPATINNTQFICKAPKVEVTDSTMKELHESFTNIKIVCLIKYTPVQNPTNPNWSTTAKNFKKFKKRTVLTRETSMRIIGGQDLFASRSEANESRIDEFFAANPHTITIMDQHNVEDDVTEEMDSDFKLKPRSTRRAGRLR